MYQMKLTLYLKQLKRHTFPKALTKAPSRSKEHAVHIVMTKVVIAYTLVPALEPEPEAAVEDYLNVRDIVLNNLECAEDRQTDLIRCKRSTQTLQRRHWASCWAS